MAWIEKKKDVLDIGCKGGELGYDAVKKGCRVTGVEKDKNFAMKAKEIYHRVITGDIEDDLVKNQLTDEYDYILLADILEHLCYPEKLLLWLRNILKRNGRILISIPNIAHWSIRSNLLYGKFQYQKKGIMDKTHLRFFTNESFQKILNQSNFDILSQDFIYAKSPLDEEYNENKKWEIIKSQKELFALQFLYLVKKK